MLGTAGGRVTKMVTFYRVLFGSMVEEMLNKHTAQWKEGFSYVYLKWPRRVKAPKLKEKKKPNEKSFQQVVVVIDHEAFFSICMCLKSCSVLFGKCHQDFIS